MPRRTVTVAVLALLAGLALAGCRSQPDRAAYVGDASLSNRQVEKLFGEVDQREGINRDTRSAVVEWWVIRELAHRIASDQGITIPDAQYAETATQFGLKPDSPIVRLYAEEQAALQAVSAKATPVKATEEDLHRVYDLGKSAGVIPPDVSFDQARSALDVEQLHQALGLRKMFSDAAVKYDVQVNPQYGEMNYSLLPFETQSGEQVPAVVVPLNADSGNSAVVDRH